MTRTPKAAAPAALLLALLALAGCSSLPTTPVASTVPGATPVASPADEEAHKLELEERQIFFVNRARAGECDILADDLQAGVPPDTVDTVDQTALIAAASKNQLVCAAMLLKAGADPNRADPAGWTPLIHATYFGASVEMLELLIANGAKVNAQNVRGATALYLAAATGHADHVRVLLAHGADPSLTTSAGYTALRVAQTKGLTQIATLIQGGAGDAAPKATTP